MCLLSEISINIASDFKRMIFQKTLFISVYIEKEENVWVILKYQPHIAEMTSGVILSKGSMLFIFKEILFQTSLNNRLLGVFIESQFL